MGPVDDIVQRLQQAGVEPEAIERALERDDPDSAIFESVLLPGMAERTVSALDIERRGGLPADEILAVMAAYGLPPPRTDQPAFTEDEAGVFVELNALADVWPPDIAIQVARVYGRLLARIAQTEIQLFRVHVA